MMPVVETAAAYMKPWSGMNLVARLRFWVLAVRKRMAGIRWELSLVSALDGVLAIGKG